MINTAHKKEIIHKKNLDKSNFEIIDIISDGIVIL